MGRGIGDAGGEAQTGKVFKLKGLTDAKVLVRSRVTLGRPTSIDIKELV